MGRILPILFNTDMVRSILNFEKTVTRRICKDGNDYTVPDMSFYDADKRTYAIHNYANKEHTEKLSLVERICPICPGDILYVRETWAFQCCIECRNLLEDESCMIEKVSTIHEDKDADSEGCYIYRADHPDPVRIIWRPSIHMPKQAARIWLKVTDVRVERLQDITEEQAIKEGAVEVKYDANTGKEMSAALDWFPVIWNSTIKKSDVALYGWEANPWVFVIEFERCEKPESEV